MKKIGITGNIGSGKSTLTKIFSLLEVPVYDADSRAKWLMQNHPDIQKGLIQLFGDEVYFLDKTLNRSFIAAKVFNNAELLASLNQLVHPTVFADFDEWLSRQHAPYIVKEAALLIESKSYLQLDEIILVCAPSALRIKRTMERDAATEEAVLARMKNQMDEAAKIPYATCILHNDGSDLLIPQVTKIHTHLLQFGTVKNAL
jgi:dephospho-CoA kinase